MTCASRNVTRRLPATGKLAGNLSAIALLIAFGTTSTAAPGIAQTIPLPRAAPKERAQFQVSQATPPGRANSPLSLSNSGAGLAPAPARQQAPAKGAAPQGRQAAPEPVIPNPRRHAPASIFQFYNDDQKAQAGRVSAFLSSLNSLTGDFVQVGPDGSRTSGSFYIQKPGKMRFEYDPPTPVAMVADGKSLAVRDTKLATQDIYPLSQTPLRYLLSERIDLLRDTQVVAINGDDLYTSVTIEEKNPAVGTSRLMLMIGTKDGQLKQWTITDPQGYDTTVAIYNLDFNKKPDPSLFKIDFTRYPTAN